MTRQNPILSPHFAFIPSEVHVDAARNKDNLLYFYKALQHNELCRCSQNWSVPGFAKLSVGPE